MLLAGVFSHCPILPAHTGHTLLRPPVLECAFACCPGETGRHGIIEYISLESIQALALYEQSLLTELIFAK